MTKLNDVAGEILEAKRGYYEKTASLSDALEEALRAVHADETRSEEWRRAETARLVDEYEAARKVRAGKYAAEIGALYEKGLSLAEGVFAKQPTPGEAAYLQAFSLKGHRTAADVEQAASALGGNAMCYSAMCDMADADGLLAPKAVPNVLVVRNLEAECLNAEILASGSAGIASKGGSFHVSGGLALALRARSAEDAFIVALSQVAEFE